MTVEYQFPVRRQVPQALGYTFQDTSGAPINLSPYVSVSLEIKLQGQLYGTVAASFSSPTSGTVQATYTFTGLGVYNVQFVCQDGFGNLLYGEPLQVLVVGNVDDLALTQLAIY